MERKKKKINERMFVVAEKDKNAKCAHEHRMENRCKI